MTRSSGARVVAAPAAPAAIITIVTIVAIVLIDAGWLVVARLRAAPRDDDFVRATCGLGLGVATTADWSFRDVDPRLAASCESELFPLPGIACPDPNHGTGVASFPDQK